MMKDEAVYKFINRIQEIITPREFEQIGFKLFDIQKEYRKSFLCLIYAGYSANVAFRNFKNLHMFAKHNYINYIQGIRMITKITKEKELGMIIKDLTVYELN